MRQHSVHRRIHSEASTRNARTYTCRPHCGKPKIFSFVQLLTGRMLWCYEDTIFNVYVHIIKVNAEWIDRLSGRRSLVRSSAV